MKTLFSIALIAIFIAFAGSLAGCGGRGVITVPSGRLNPSVSQDANQTPKRRKPQPQVYVPNSNSTITVYDQNGNQIATSGSFANLNGPREIAFDTSNGYLYVSDSPNGNIVDTPNNTITVYDRNGNQIATSGTFPNLDGVRGIAFDPSNGYLYATNLGNSTMTVYDQNGNQITTSGAFPNLNGPRGIAYDSSNGNFYVSNTASNRITEYDQNGNQIATSGTFPNLDGPRGITFDSSNNYLYVTNYGNDTITIYDQNGNRIAISGTLPSQPVGIVFDPMNDSLYVTYENINTLAVYDQYLNQITTSGNFPNLSGPLYLAVAPGASESPYHSLR